MLICRALTDHREIDFAVPGRGLLEIDSASVNGGVALTDVLEDEFRGLLRVSEEGTFFQADVLPVFPLFQAASATRVETATNQPIINQPIIKIYGTSQREKKSKISLLIDLEREISI